MTVPFANATVLIRGQDRVVNADPELDMLIRWRGFEQFGTFILFKKLHTDSFSESWRAATLLGDTLGPAVALRRFVGGDRNAIIDAIQAAAPVLPLLEGTTLAREQQCGIVDGLPWLAHEYRGGRSLQQIVFKAAGGRPPQPIPIDQALTIVEKITQSLVTLGAMRLHGSRLVHGALIPDFVWISEEGEVRVSGQRLGTGLVASLDDPLTAPLLGPYLAAELRRGTPPNAASDIYAAGAILFFMLTGGAPPDAGERDEVSNAIVNARLLSTDEPLPIELRRILEKSLNHDAPARYPAPSDLQKAIHSLRQGDSYGATTFNLAFYIHALLRDDLQKEAAEREKEQKVNVASYAARSREASDAEAPGGPSPQKEAPPPRPQPQPVMRRGRRGWAIAAILSATLAVVALATVFFTVRSRPPSEQNPPVGTEPPPRGGQLSRPTITPPPPSPTAAPITTAAADDRALEQERTRAFEEAVNKRLQEEMAKLQAEYDARLQEQRKAQLPTPAPSRPTSTPRPAPSVPSAAAFDVQQRSARQDDSDTAALPPPSPQPSTVVPETKEGDLVPLGDVDTPPRVTKSLTPIYPPLARRQKIEGDVILTALISETGKVLDVRILRGDVRKMGLDEAALSAVRRWQFAPATKDGVQVRTWFPISVNFTVH